MTTPTSPRPFEWTPQAIEILKKMRSEGKSFTDIAAELGASRNAVGGKAKRLGLATSAAGIPLRSTKVNKPRAPRAPRKPKTVGPIAASRPCKPVPLVKLRDFHCRSVVGRGKDGLATYCGQRVKPGTSWCPEHYRLYTDPERTLRHGQAGTYH